MSKPKQQTFEVHVKADIYFSATIQANSLEEALQKANTLKYQGFWDASGVVLDAEYEIIGVFK